MKVNILLAVILLGGCVTTQEDRVCLDWGHYPIVEERCVPLYGNVVCVTEERTRYWCKLYEETNENISSSNNRFDIYDRMGRRSV